MGERVKKIGLKIRLERTKRGLSQEKLAELANLHKNSISYIERGETVATINTLEQIADALEVTFEQLVDISGI